MKTKICILNVLILRFLAMQASEHTIIKNTHYGDIFETRSKTQTYKQLFHLDNQTFDILCKYIDFIKQQRHTIANHGSEKQPVIFQNLMEYIKYINPIFYHNVLQHMEKRLLNPDQEYKLYLKYKETNLLQKISKEELQLETDLKEFRESWSKTQIVS